MVETSTSSSWVRTGTIEVTMLPSSGPTNAPTATPAKALYMPNRAARAWGGVVSALLGCWAFSIIDSTGPTR
jgi:hypothetical protein